MFKFLEHTKQVKNNYVGVLNKASKHKHLQIEINSND